MYKDVERILNNALKSNGWLIKKPIHGLSKECYIAQNNQQTVFIKFDVNVPPLKRVSE